jgi:Domain of unknown function (DUF6316)
MTRVESIDTGADCGLKGVHRVALLQSLAALHRDATACTHNVQYRASMSRRPRKGEPPERHSRSDRIVLARGRWYVITRERVDVGPYDTQADALIASEHLAQALDGIDEPAVVLALINEFARRRLALLTKG